MVGADPEIASWLRRPDAPDKVLLFANSRRRCDELFVSLQGVCDHVVLLHYSNLDAGERADTELLLRRSPRAVCVATSTLELGIDIGDIDTVVLADAPWSALSLVQRVGRSGRRAGEASAVAFAPDDRTLLRVLASWGTDAAEAPGDGLLSRYPSVAVQQAITLTRGSPRLRLRPDRLSSSFEDSPALEGNDATDVLEQLRHDGVLVEHPLSRSYEFAANTPHSDSYERWSNFARDRASWLLAHKGQTMSAVEFDQPADRGDVILFGGRCWRVTSVNVVPTGLVPNPVRIHYSDAPPLVASALASRMRDLFIADDMPAQAMLEAVCATRMAGLRERLGPVVRGGGVPVVWNERGRKLLTFAGTRANLLLRSVIVGASRVDEIGIELERDLPLVELAEIVPPYEEILESARRGWRRLANSVTTTRWHEMLPTHLRRTEVISQLDGTGVAAAIETLRQGHVVPVEGFGTSL
jgi:ATP-dependent Lhr-like helicase